MVLGTLPLLLACAPKDARNHSEVRPYYEDSKIPHNVQWDYEGWNPQSWIADKGSAKAVMDDLYAGKIITKQYIDDEIPILEVGDGFMDLSTREKRRVAAFVDHVFGVTKTSPNGTFIVKRAGADDPIGLYTKHGLQLQ